MTPEQRTDPANVVGKPEIELFRETSLQSS